MGRLDEKVKVSIPSSGSIQFLQKSMGQGVLLAGLSQSPQAGQFNSYSLCIGCLMFYELVGLNPLKRVNSILTASAYLEDMGVDYMSQSPQAGQFNSYNDNYKNVKIRVFNSLNPLKRVNSILTDLLFCIDLEPNSLNPLKRVNSILTVSETVVTTNKPYLSQSPQAGQFNSYSLRNSSYYKQAVSVSIPSSGSIQFLPF